MNIGVIFGSRSTEHDVSITSAYGVTMGLKKNTDHKVFPIYITREGQWIHDPAFIEINSFTTFDATKYKDTTFNIDFSKTEKLCFTQSSGGMFGKKVSVELDFIFPVLHGMNGEDGTIQGIFDMLQVPYMGPSVQGSAVGMNKIVMKAVFKSIGIPGVKMLTASKGTYNKEYTLKELRMPLIVKPANLGSSIGISKVETADDLDNAVEVALHYDNYIMIEECVQNLMELNCSVSEIKGEVVTTVVEQPIGSTEFLSFEEKYVADDGGTMQGLKNRVNIPAKISPELSDRIRDYCKVIYTNLFCKGGAPRIDFLYDSKSGELYVNEINTVPGALQMHLWDKSGYPVGVFLQNLIDTGIEKSLERKVNIDFDSNIIGHTIAFTK
ncbi:D-alanine--D-alanine ligase [Candidatus Gracilibacteria bacterium]|nr:D-alanine--D-alanine ligase [Candidatus Gracilibacteria bacterium]